MKHTYGRTIIKVDTEQKNYFTFADGTEIRLERGYNNLDGQYTNQVRGKCISSELIPLNAEVLFHFNSLHESNEIFDHNYLTLEEIKGNYKLYSIPDNECFLWKKEGGSKWETIPPFVTALRIYEPYNGVLEGVTPKKLNNILYITSGELKGMAAHTLKASDYCIIFRGDNGVDEKIIRLRHFEKDKSDREEVIAIDKDITNKIKKGELHIGYNELDCKSIKE